MKQKRTYRVVVREVREYERYVEAETAQEAGLKVLRELGPWVTGVRQRTVKETRRLPPNRGDPKEGR